MTAKSCNLTTVPCSQLVQDIKSLLWGTVVKEDVFHRWAQGTSRCYSSMLGTCFSSIYNYAAIPTLFFVAGFYFSPHENTALIQAEGGPCAVIAPLQAFILKLLLAESDLSTWQGLTVDRSDQLLVNAMTEILAQAVDPIDKKYSIFLIDKQGIANGQLLEQRPESDAESVLPESLCTANTSTPLSELALDSNVFHSLLRSVFDSSFFPNSTLMLMFLLNIAGFTSSVVSRKLNSFLLKTSVCLRISLVYYYFCTQSYQQKEYLR